MQHSLLKLYRPREDAVPTSETFTEKQLERIAKRFRWHIDEVREEYKSAGDLIATQVIIASYRKVVEEHKRKRILPPRTDSGSNGTERSHVT